MARSMPDALESVATKKALRASGQAGCRQTPGELCSAACHCRAGDGPEPRVDRTRSDRFRVFAARALDFLGLRN